MVWVLTDDVIHSLPLNLLQVVGRGQRRWGERKWGQCCTDPVYSLPTHPGAEMLPSLLTSIPGTVCVGDAHGQDPCLAVTLRRLHMAPMCSQGRGDGSVGKNAAVTSEDLFIPRGS